MQQRGKKIWRANVTIKRKLARSKKTKRGTHLGTNLVAALACLQVNNLTHFQV